MKKRTKKLLLRYARCCKCPALKLIKFFCRPAARFFLFTKRSACLLVFHAILSIVIHKTTR